MFSGAFGLDVVESSLGIYLFSLLGNHRDWIGRPLMEDSGSSIYIQLVANTHGPTMKMGPHLPFGVAVLLLVRRSNERPSGLTPSSPRPSVDWIAPNRRHGSPGSEKRTRWTSCYS